MASNHQAAGSTPAEGAQEIFTLVCSECHAGWYSDKPTGVHAKCGKKAELRGRVLQIPLK